MQYKAYFYDIINIIFGIINIILLLIIIIILFINIPLYFRNYYVDQLTNIFPSFIYDTENAINNINEIIIDNIEYSQYNKMYNFKYLMNKVSELNISNHDNNNNYYCINKAIQLSCNVLPVTFYYKNNTIVYKYLTLDLYKLISTIKYSYDTSVIFYYNNSFIISYYNTDITSCNINEYIYDKKYFIRNIIIKNYYIKLIIKNKLVPYNIDIYVYVLVIISVISLISKIITFKLFIVKTNKINDISLLYKNMLDQIFPKQIVNNIILNNNIFFNVRQCCIMFSDIVGFTEITHNKDGEFIINLLNTLFTEFDKASESYDILKIKTIGDCYMCTSGIFNEKIINQTETEFKITKIINIIHFGLYIINISNNIGIDIRIGASYGDFIAGVIKSNRCPIFDVWGDIVNLASRLENKSKKNYILISKNMYDEIFETHTNYFNDDSQITLNIKGIGIIQSYFIAK